MHSGIQKFKYGCHRHSSVDTTSTPKLQLFLFALPVCASEWECTKQNMRPNQKYIQYPQCCFSHIVTERVEAPQHSFTIEANATKLLTSFSLQAVNHRYISPSPVIGLRQNTVTFTTNTVSVIHMNTHCTDNGERFETDWG